MRERAQGIDNAAGKQKIVVELYEKFFRNAFPRMADRLGIVYTPVEVVDFILHSVAHVLETEFGLSLGSKNVHIIDPFTGTGTFITRLLQSGLIEEKDLPYKYKHEIHANEIVLLAYYIAAINIESTYHAIVGGEYEPFEGICLTDTFQMYEKPDMIQALLEDNSKRRKRQKKLDVKVIVGNPPYSVGQRSANDNNQNVVYPQLDERIRATYAARSDATNKNANYDSYVRAIRWASDRIGGSGVVGFVTNASIFDGSAFDGLRRCLVEEFSNLYVFHLRGNARTSGELRRKEGDNAFGIGTRAPVAISLLVKNPAAAERGKIYFHDVGDFLSREEKLAKIEAFESIAGISAEDAWTQIEPDAHGDWLNQRDGGFEQFVPMGAQGHEPLFCSYCRGVQTGRDSWAYNASKRGLWRNVERMVAFCNAELERIKGKEPWETPSELRRAIADHAEKDSQKVSWSRSLIQELARNELRLDPSGVVPSLYRPFNKQWMYFSRQLNEMVYQMPRFFPSAEAENILIGVSASESRSAWSVFITDAVPSLHAVDMVGSQFFPLYLYDEPGEGDGDSKQRGLFDEETEAGERRRRYAITDEGLAHFQEAYPGEKIGKEDIFYYVYGILHSPDYRERFKDNLGKELPRIPCVASAEDFWAFSLAGERLAELHLHYDGVERYPAQIDGLADGLPPEAFRVEKMRFGGRGRNRDKTTIHYNDHITVRGIPLEAYDYVVNGRPAIEWVIERQGVRVDKASGIVNDANDWAIETMENPRYPLDLLLRVITVSLETMKIVKALPALRIDEEAEQVA